MEFIKWIVTSITISVASFFGMEPATSPTPETTVDEYANVRSLAELNSTPKNVEPTTQAKNVPIADSKPKIEKADAPKTNATPPSVSSGSTSYISKELGIRFNYPSTWDVEYTKRADGQEQIVIASPDFELGSDIKGEFMTLAFNKSWTAGPKSAETTPQEYVDIKMDYYKKNPLTQGVIQPVSLKKQPAFLKRTLTEPGIAAVWTVYGGKEFSLTYMYPAWAPALENRLNTIIKSLEFETPSAVGSITPRIAIPTNLSNELLRSKQEQAMRAMAGVEPSLFYEILKLTLRIQASKLLDIPTLRSFATEWGSKSAATYAEVSKIVSAGTGIETMTVAELDALITTMTRLQREKMNMLSAYNAIPIQEFEKLDAENPVIDLEPGAPSFPITSP